MEKIANIDISQLRDGDVYFQKNSFDILDVNTYLSPIVFFGINFWNRINNEKICPANHCGIIVKIKGAYFVYEAKSEGIVCTPLNKKLKKKNIKSIYIKRYDLTLKEQFLVIQKAKSCLGIKYDFASLFKQFFRQLFNNKIDLEKKSEDKKIKYNCSEFCAAVYSILSITFNNIKSVDPEDLWKDSRSIIVGKLK